MKYIAAIIGLMAWMACTILLAITMLGIIVVFFVEEYWEIPSKLLKVFEN